MKLTSTSAPLMLDNWTQLDYKRLQSTNVNPGQQWMAPNWVGGHRRRLQAYITLAAYRENSSRVLLRHLYPDQTEEIDSRREYGDVELVLEQIRSALIGDNLEISVKDGNENTENLLREWVDKERFTTKVFDSTKNEVIYGDGVYELQWDGKKRRPRLVVWDPGFYFPVLDNVHDYPKKVHIAWQLTSEEAQAQGFNRDKLVVLRRTYELREVAPYSVRWEPQQVSESCFFKEAYFIADSVKVSVDDFTETNARWVTREIDLGIDFIPIVHIPNTVAETEHYGKSAISSVLQLIDDIQSVDSDLQASARTTGNPVFATAGLLDDGDNDIAIYPGRVLQLAEGGKIDVISGAAGLAGLSALRDQLLDRLSINLRIPAAQLGRINATDVPSGIALQLSFSPMQSLINEMRLVRQDKYRVLFKFVQRLFMREHLLQQESPVEIVFGVFMPVDKEAAIKNIIELRVNNLISQNTALTMLRGVGVPINDIDSELAEIAKRDFKGATELFDATGSETQVENYLQISQN